MSDIRRIDISEAQRNVLVGAVCADPCLHAECVAIRMIAAAFDAALPADPDTTARLRSHSDSQQDGEPDV